MTSHEEPRNNSAFVRISTIESRDELVKENESVKIK